MSLTYTLDRPLCPETIRRALLRQEELFGFRDVNWVLDVLWAAYPDHTPAEIREGVEDVLRESL